MADIECRVVIASVSLALQKDGKTVWLPVAIQTFKAAGDGNSTT